MFLEAARNWMDPASGPLASRPSQDYVIANALPSLLAGPLGLTNPYLNGALWLALSMVVIALPMLMPSIRTFNARRLLMGVIVVGGPLAVLMVHRVGGYDVALCAALIVAALARSPWIAAIGWSVAGFQHSSIAVMALAAYLACAFWVSRSWREPRTWVPLAAVAAGAILNVGWSQAIGLTTDRWDVYRLYPVSLYVDGLIGGLPLSLYGVLGIAWIVLLDRRVRHSASSRAVLTIGILTAIVVPVTALDETRVPALVMMPALLWWVRTIDMHVPGPTADALPRKYAIPAIIVPVVMVIGGGPYDYGWDFLLYFRTSLTGL